MTQHLVIYEQGQDSRVEHLMREAVEAPKDREIEGGRPHLEGEGRVQASDGR